MSHKYRDGRFSVLLAATLLISVTCWPARAQIGGEPAGDVASSIQAADSRLELVGQVGGGATAVALSDTLVYAGIGGEFVVFDVTDPTAMTVIGRLRVSFQPIHNIVLDGHYAYFAVETLGLVIVDISDPSAPRQISQSDVAGFDIGDIAIHGSLLYAISDLGLHIIDVTDPQAPIEIAFCAMSGIGSLSALAVSGQYAYVVRNGYGIIVIDVADPASLLEIGDFTQWPNAEDIAVLGEYAYLATDTSGLRVIDISDPSAMHEIGYWSSSQHPLKVIAAGDYAYVGAPQSLCVVDVSNPSVPATVGCYIGSPRIRDVSIAGERAIVADTQGVRILRVPDSSISDPMDHNQTRNGADDEVALVPPVASVLPPVRTQTSDDRVLDSPPEQIGLYTIMTEAVDLAVGDDVYVAAGDSGVRVVDVTDPTTPEEVSHVDVPGIASSLVVGRSYVYAATARFGLRVIDVADRLSPVEVGNVPAGDGMYTYNAAIDGDVAFVVDASGLRTFDVSDPTAPAPLGLEQIYPACNDLMFRDLAVVDGNVYMIENSEHWHLGRCRIMFIFRVISPAELEYTGFYRTQSWVRDVAVSGDLAVIACQDALEFVDLTDRAVPIRAALYPLGDARGVALAGNYLFAASAEGVTVLDVSDPTAPFVVAFYATPSPAEKVAIVGDIVYVADGPGGLLILRFDQATPSSTAWFPVVSTP